VTRAGVRQALPLLTCARYELLPTANTEETVLSLVPRDVVITITASPVRGLDPTLDLTERLSAQRYQVVPHLSARLISDGGHLAEIVTRLTAAGVTDVFVPAGDAVPPAGGFTSALAVLERLTELGRPFAEVGITGYPQTHPKIDDDITIQAMWDKRRHATYIVSNLCFDPAALRQWIARIRRRGVTLPLLVGLAGPVDRARLIQMATKIGAAESARFLAGHASWFARLGAPGGYQPQRLLGRIGDVLAAPESAVRGLHIFTFNQVSKTEEWRQSMLAKLAAR